MAGVGPELSSELSCELTRILSCAYPTSLAKLSDICARADALTIRACIYHRPPCAIAKLATIVSDALPLWHYSAGLLQSLSHSPAFKDQILSQSPGLLDALLTKANSTQHDFDELCDSCVTLLSRPLPDAIPLPASAQSFFHRVFQRATLQANVGKIKSIYYMLNGACKGLLSIVSSKAREEFDQELVNILSSNDASRDSMLRLWCFGIVILSEHPETIGRAPSLSDGYNTPIPSPTLNWTTRSGRKLFGSASNLNKTVGLAYLSVVWATKGGVEVPDDEAIEGIRIAIRTLQLVDRQVREAWPNSNQVWRTTFAKLPLKVQRHAIHPAVQLEALCVYAMVAGEAKMSQQVIALYESAVPKITSFIDAEMLREVLSISLPLFAPHIQQTAVNSLMTLILRASVHPTSALEMCNVNILVDELAAIFPHYPQLGNSVLASLSSQGLQDAVQAFVRADCGSGYLTNICPTYTAMVHRSLVSATIAMILSASFSTDSAMQSLPTPLGIALINKQQRLPIFATKCLHQTTPNKTTSVSLFEQECTPLSSMPLQNWRDRLRVDLEGQGHFQRDMIIRSVAQICHDLESRCENIEEPLRQERQKTQGLTAELSELRGKLTNLETKRWEDREHMDGLSDDNARLENEKDQLSTQLHQLRIDLKNKIRSAEDTLCASREEHSSREVQLRSTILDCEEEIRVQENKIEKLQKNTADLTGQLNETQQEICMLNNQRNNLQSETNSTRDELESQRQEVSEQAGRISQLTDEKTTLEKRLQDTTAELASVNGKLDDLQDLHEELAKASREALQDLEAQFESDKETAATNAAKQYDELDERYQESLHTSREAAKAYEAVKRELQQVQATTLHLGSRVEELTHLCSKKDQEINELRAWQDGFRKHFDCAPEPPLVRTDSHRVSESANTRTPRQHRRRKSAMPPQDVLPKASVGPQDFTSTVVESIANASFTSSDSHSSQRGSTPKRAKPHASFKIPEMHTPYSNRPVFAPKSKKPSSASRPALRPVSPNRRHTVGFTIPESNREQDPKQCLPLRNRGASVHAFEQEDFDMDDLLTSTPFTPGNFATGTGKGPEDGSTTEL